jgi:hypothetical protein
MSFKCNFCDSNLSSNYYLSKHQKTAKKCLAIQGVIIPKSDFECNICESVFLHKSVLVTHLKSCTKKNEAELNKKNIMELQKKYNTLQNKYNILDTKYEILMQEKKEWKEKEEKLLESKYEMIMEERKEWKIQQKELLDNITKSALSKTNTTNNTNNKNIINITYTRTDEELKNIYEQHLTPSHIEGGISAITQLIVDKVVTNEEGVKMISITDKSRGTARYKLPTGEMVTDNGLTNFTNKNRNIIMKKIYSIACEKDISDKILDEDTNISKGYTEISDDLEGNNLRSSLIKKI